ncbi:MAG: hypothetical protein E7324_01490 [Clostridiales bacterium]|nr:hypothetical protein [Clostridiales bacterium]
MKKTILLLLVLLMMPCLALASSASSSWFAVEEEGISVRLPNREKYTIVTPENYEEYMDLCVAHGNTENNVRRRFESGHVIMELYREGMEGWMRLEVYEDEWTRYAWDSVSMMDGPFKRLPQELESTLWLSDHGYKLYGLDDVISNRYINGRLISYPPYDYESGMVNIHFYHGKAYLLIYADTKPATHTKHWADGVYDIVNKAFLRSDSFRRENKEWAQETHPTDLILGSDSLALNLHPGEYTVMGITESGAKISLQAGDKTYQATVKEREFSCKVPLEAGENVIRVTASKAKRLDETAQLTITTDPETAELVLMECPYGSVSEKGMKVKGKTSPQGSVQIRLDDQEAVAVPVNEKGVFEYSFEASFFDDHKIEIIASQEGLEDCGAIFDFLPMPESAQKAVNTYRKLLAEKKLSAVIADMYENPEAHIGERYEINFDYDWKTGNVTYFDGYAVAEKMVAIKHEGENYRVPIQLIFPNYGDDILVNKGTVIVFGQMIEPAMTEPAIPRMEVQLAVYYK